MGELGPRAHWFEPWDEVLDWNPPWAKWFVGGKLNASYNCLDRHVEAGPRRPRRLPLGGRGRRAPHDHLRRSARDDVPLRQRAQGAWACERDDRVAIYLPMIPEAPAAMLACARIGAPHSVVFGGFSAEAVKDRINDCEAKVLVTADFSLRRGKPLPMKESIDKVLPDCPSIEHCVVVRRTGGDIPWTEGRDVWWHEATRGRLARLPGRAARRRADALPALHLGHDRQAEGHRAHDRRLHDRRRRHPQADLRHQARDATSSGARPTSAGSPATATSSTARSPTAARRSSTRARPTIRTRTAGGRSSSATSAPSSTRRRRRSAPASSGAASTPTGTTSARCGCSAASASRSTRRPGSGTTR